MSQKNEAYTAIQKALQSISDNPMQSMIFCFSSFRSLERVDCMNQTSLVTLPYIVCAASQACVSVYHQILKHNDELLQGLHERMEALSLTYSRHIHLSSSVISSLDFPIFRRSLLRDCSSSRRHGSQSDGSLIKLGTMRGEMKA